MKFNNANEIEAHIASQDPLACNVCQAVLHWLRNRSKIWIVTTETSSAVVYGTTMTQAIENAGLNPNALNNDPDCICALEIDPDEVGRFYQSPKHKNMIIRKDANAKGNYDS